MTREQGKKLCGLYNRSDIEALKFLKGFVTEEQMPLLERAIFLNETTDIGDGSVPATPEQEEEYSDYKTMLLESFGIEFRCGDAFYGGYFYDGNESSPTITDRYFYILEEDNGERYIHIEGNVYLRGETEYDYECSEWSGFYIPVKEAQQMLIEGTFFDYVDENAKYCESVSEEKAVEICLSYFNGKSGTELKIENIDENTPLGDYFFER